jgi:hypothetical protein
MGFLGTRLTPIPSDDVAALQPFLTHLRTSQLSGPRKIFDQEERENTSIRVIPKTVKSDNFYFLFFADAADRVFRVFGREPRLLPAEIATRISANTSLGGI